MSELEVVTTVPQESQIAEAIATAETIPQEQAPVAEPRKIKVKYLHEDKEVTDEEAVPLIQKGMDYDRVKTQADQLQEDRKFIEGLAKEYGMDAATLKAELSKAARATKAQELIDKGIPDDVVDEILENRKYREEQKARETQAQADTRRQNDAAAFLKEYPDVKPTDIPQSVWKDVEEGIPLIHAYAKHENSILRAQVQKTSMLAAVQTQNFENSNAAPGSINGTASAPDYYSPERVEKMSDRQVADNWTKIQASMKKWK